MFGVAWWIPGSLLGGKQVEQARQWSWKLCWKIKNHVEKERKKFHGGTHISFLCMSTAHVSEEGILDLIQLPLHPHCEGKSSLIAALIPTPFPTSIMFFQAFSKYWSQFGVFFLWIMTTLIFFFFFFFFEVYMWKKKLQCHADINSRRISINWHLHIFTGYKPSSGMKVIATETENVKDRIRRWSLIALEPVENSFTSWICMSYTHKSIHQQEWVRLRMNLRFKYAQSTGRKGVFNFSTFFLFPYL